MTSNKLIIISGPTAIGKTSFSIHLAKYLKAEIFSADSRQFYKEMSIGTAVPSKKDLSAVKHHFIQHRSIFENYSVGQYEKDILLRLNTYFKNHQYAILVGGSGLYNDAVRFGLDDFPEIPNDIQLKVRSDYEKKGLNFLQLELNKIDPVYYRQVDLNNHVRLMRALEVCYSGNFPYSYYLNNKPKKRPFEIQSYALIADRKLIYARINHRVDQMIEMGLVQEAEYLYPHRMLNALQTVGYKELFTYFDGLSTLEEAVQNMKQNTRRFAKRQLSWLKRDSSLKFIPHDSDPLKLIL